MGAITALAVGARSLKSRKMSSTMQFCYTRFVLYKRGDRLYVKEAELIDSFFELRSSIEGLALATYIAEVLSDVTVEEAENDLLRLSLNSLYCIANKKHPIEKIKAVFELRAASILGFMPDVIACHSCGARGGDFFFDIMGGIIECADCRKRAADERLEHPDPHESHILCVLSEGAKIALEYAVHSPLQRIFSFNLPENDMRLFSRAAEEYLLNQLGHGFKALDFYKEIKRG